VVRCLQNNLPYSTYQPKKGTPLCPHTTSKYLYCVTISWNNQKPKHWRLRRCSSRAEGTNKQSITSSNCWFFFSKTLLLPGYMILLFHSIGYIITVPYGLSLSQTTKPIEGKTTTVQVHTGTCYHTASATNNICSNVGISNLSPLLSSPRSLS
jgi:hypothetical protein